MNITPVHLSAFVDFSNIFFRYWTKQSTSELSLMATEMVSTMVFFPIKKLFLRNKNLNKICRCLLKTILWYKFLFMLYFHLFGFGGYSCTQISYKIYLSIIYFIWCTARYMMRQTRVPPNITKSTKLWDAQCSPELAYRSMEFCVPENLIFLALCLFSVMLKWHIFGNNFIN